MSVPAYDHIVVVMMENHDYSEIIGNTQAPYINGLAAGGALLSNYTAITHPSEPNFLRPVRWQHVRRHRRQCPQRAGSDPCDDSARGREDLHGLHRTS